MDTAWAAVALALAVDPQDARRAAAPGEQDAGGQGGVEAQDLRIVANGRRFIGRAQQARGFLIDEGRLKLDPAESVRNAVDALFRLERGRTPEDLIRIGEALRDLLRDPSQTRLRRNFTVWINSLLHRKTGGHTIEDIEPINDILEPSTMLAERIQSWFDEATRKGIQQGRTEGLDEGILKGRMEGEAKLLARLLERRFGPLPQPVAERLAGASEAQLEAWGEAVLTAPTLDAVFADNRH